MSRWTIHEFDLVVSTNVLAAEFVRAGLAGDTGIDGHVFVALAQSAGRGQYERSFASPRGGLYATIVLEGIGEEVRAPLPLLVGLAAARALIAGEERIAGVQIRWPNDLVIGERKIGGILCEGIASGARWIALVGIGINVNSDPAELPSTATTMRAVDGRQRDLGRMLGRILEALAEVLAPGADWRGEFAGRDAIRGRRVVVMVDGKRLSGGAEGVSATGALIVATSEGREEVARGSLVEIDGRSVR